MIDYIAANNGAIELRSNGSLMGAAKTWEQAINIIHRAGGLADRVMASSSVDFAEEYGFASQKAFDDLWDDICSAV